MTMIMEYLISYLSSSIPILQKISDGQKLFFDEAWSLVTLYKKYKDTDSIVDYVEDTPKSGYTQLRVEVENLVKETIALRTSSPATPLFGRSAALSGQWNHYS